MGRVEVFYNETWGAVCNDKWDIIAGRVVCRQLGYADAVSVLESHPFVPDKKKTVWLDGVSCNGSESSLFGCKHGGLRKHSCDHTKIAGVNCTISSGTHHLYLSRAND